MVRTVAVLGGTLVAALVVGTAADASTQRRVNGIITAVEAQSLTIQPHGKRSVAIGRLDPARTHVTLDGRPAKATELRVTYDAKAELGLDDVWISVRAASQ
jgi:hypothetical protein